MTIFVSGDSNSVRRDGWVAGLIAHPDTPAEVRNISIGGAPSHMSLLRAMRETGMGRGDVLIWAYGINDALYIRNAGYTVDEMIGVLRQIIAICADRGVVFAPMIFQPRRPSQIRRKSPYRAALHDLFGASGIPYFDVDEAYLAVHPDSATLPVEFYQDYLHYANDPAVFGHIVAGALDLIRRGRVPHHPGADLPSIRLVTDFPGAGRGVLENSAVGRVTTWDPGPDGVQVRLPGPGRIVGLFVTTTRQGGVWNLTFQGASDQVSVAFADRDFNRTMLKFISPEAVTGRSFAHDGPEILRIGWSDEPGRVLADFWFLSEPDPQDRSGREARLVAVMTENRGQCREGGTGCA
ncbi:MAG: SGNH/GDSL hydrolase family protein [Paracoccus sp. (in: a-proteobacteria)]|jgi:hypothetical protein|uniref:SGNH/GDSL hydrolase family protein n=1 Tax=unclassified Paracoccus (in: a-proteobacteria) TaxID=2688777 RepID=UPI000C4D211E|nr:MULTISPECIES: SGNH/GDSL hydrolase family protein [unclassified Paracoccus (in: a-proteobacteria)]MAN55995.1 hypothetical protein [Paracoccus sp. (in: a-proteobacteria)]|tara:strand:+ start:3738 stop:4790 length:1053 start_codon:yes stop_codon:yes gene_type:complete